MKIKLLLLSLLSLMSAIICRAQTASDYIIQGRSYLAVSNIASASVSFSNAVALSPNDPTANVFYGISRLFALPSQPGVSNFLTTLGVPTTGRNIYQWKARLPHDAQRFPIAPAGVSLSDATALARGSVLGEIIGAEANLAVVTDTNFTLALTVQDTSITAVTMDYGDIQLVRSFLDGMEYFVYNTYDWNLDVQLTVLRSLYSSNTFDIGTLLSEYPSLLTFSTTNDLLSAKAAFVKSANTYFTASSIIRNRPADVTRLFNYAPDDAQDETPFRETLFDVASSLTNGPVILEANSNYSVFLSPTLTGRESPRSFFPRIHGSGFVLGTFPDSTFGGVLTGFSSDTFDNSLAKHLTPIPDIVAAHSLVEFMVHSIGGHGYVIQSSANLHDWTNVMAFVAFTNRYVFNDPAGHGDPARFYRVVDVHNNLPPPVNDNFANASPIVGLGNYVTGYNINATPEPGGSSEPAIWWNWTAPISGLVVATTSGSPSFALPVVCIGDAITNLSYPQTTTLNGGFDFAYQGFPFFAVAGTVYHIQVGVPPPFFSPSYYGAVQLVVTTPPTLIVTSPADGATLPASSGLTISATASDTYGAIASIFYSYYSDAFIGGGSGTVKGSSLSLTFTNLPSSGYEVSITAYDSFGVPAEQDLHVQIQ